MNQRIVRLVLILLLIGLVVWIDLPSNPGVKIGNFSRNLDTVLGLDLQGGMQVLLEVDKPENFEVSAQEMSDARTIFENRSNGLGVSEVSFQVAGTRRIVGEFPGLVDTEEVVAVLRETGQLEFVDMGSTPLPAGTVIKTDLDNLIPENPIDAQDLQNKVWHTIMTGDLLKSVAVTANQLGQPEVAFELKPEGAVIFKDYTSNNQGKFLAIVLDKTIISTPTIRATIEDKGVIQGQFTNEEANNLAIQLRYGSLPIPFKVVESRVVGPTLGADSLNKSIIAGLVGFIIVALFMSIYYRLPGVVAIFSIITYALITLVLFKVIPVTLTLPGIAGVLLSTGGALDANILIFERLKEELRAGRTVKQALDLAWKRAWPSIRDSNFATIITSAILFWFGSAYGASIVKGFALTLAIGVAVSLFCAIVITRTFLNEIIALIQPKDNSKWFGA
jgi:preprotein translocase subunit SecD